MAEDIRGYCPTHQKKVLNTRQNATIPRTILTVALTLSVALMAANHDEFFSKRERSLILIVPI